MKRLFLLLALVAMVASSCTRDDTNIWDKLNDQEDVCSSMDDVMFMEYCYQNFDVNKDGKVSPFEAKSVRSINIKGLEIYSIKGVEYFEILESINAGGTPLRNVDLSFNKLLTSFGFSGCGSMTSMVLPKNIITITSSAFSGCDKLEKINIPNSVTTIGDYAFNGCTSLTSVTIPDSVTTIGDWAFSGCTGELIINSKIVETDYDDSYYLSTPGWLKGSNFSSLTIGNGVTLIGDYALFDCDSLTSVTIPDSVTTIGDGAFSSCRSLTSVYCKATTPPSLGGYGVFDYNVREIYVPTESVDAYKSDWSEYASAIVGCDF